MRRGEAAWAVLVLALSAAGSSAEGASVALRVGVFSPDGDSELWEENADTFTVEVGDFAGGVGGLEVAFELNEFVDLAFGVEGYARRVDSMYRDFVREDGTEIEQELELTVAPITAGIRLLPFGKLRAVSPYVTGGFGLYPYEYRERGEFIDFSTFDIFGDVFRDRGVGTGAYAGAGVEVRIARRWLAFGEVRRHWAGADHGEDFVDFGEFDLGARELVFGVAVRF